MTRTVLVVEKDEAVAAKLRDGLNAGDYAVSSVPQRRAISGIKSSRPDIIVLDPRTLSHDRALAISQTARRVGNTPVLRLVFETRWPQDELEGTGYLVVSPALEDIAPRVRTLLHARTQIREQMEAPNGDPIVSLGGIQLDFKARVLRGSSGDVHLTPKETRLLLAFMMHPGVVLTRGWLMKEIWDTDYTGDTRTLYVHIRWLRQKIEADPATPRCLITVRGVGYLYTPSE